MGGAGVLTLYYGQFNFPTYFDANIEEDMRQLPIQERKVQKPRQRVVNLVLMSNSYQ